MPFVFAPRCVYYTSIIKCKLKLVGEYDQEIPQSQTEEKPVVS